MKIKRHVKLANLKIHRPTSKDLGVVTVVNLAPRGSEFEKTSSVNTDAKLTTMNMSDATSKNFDLVATVNLAPVDPNRKNLNLTS